MLGAIVRVSIPVGFSRSLQPNCFSMSMILTSLFQSLSGFHARCNPLFHLLNATGGIWFQSLSGFHARCNDILSHFPGLCPGSFNPCRVFTLAATSCVCLLIRSLCFVSIPVGFSRSLQHRRFLAAPWSRSQFQSLSGFHARCNFFGLTYAFCRVNLSFNPCRVFTLAAT